MSIAFLGLSTNLKNKKANLKIAKKKLHLECKILKESSIYETESWGISNQPDYLNQVVKITTELTPQKLLKFILKIELEMGRKRKYKFAPRIIDIDILFYDQKILKTDSLQIPHPYISERNFVLAPLNELNPNFIHPVLKLSINQLFQQCTDTKKYSILS
jgi:2-amino-4-hydroxy-6-hydroxymethyldihydropteridine diphosphokinase